MLITIDNKQYTLALDKYIAPVNTCLKLISKDDPSVYRKITINPTHLFKSPRTVLIKTYAENESWIDQFLAYDLLTTLGLTNLSGLVTVPVCQIKPHVFAELLIPTLIPYK